MSGPADAARPAPSALAPLGHRVFAALWIATVASNVGTWMNDVGAGWLMTTLSASPAMVALVQTATTLPVFLFALPAGALADIVDRRRLLLVLNAAMMAVAALLALVVAAGAMTPTLLLAFTFALGAGAAFMAPAWQAIVPGLVPRGELAAAISLNSVGINVSRAIGPALAGVLIVVLGIWSPFLMNAISFLGILAVLWFWKGEAPRESRLPPERLVPAMLAGLRYARRSPPLGRTILRAVAFFSFASAYWAMLPLVARDVLAGGPGLYGILLGAVGAGAVAGAALLPRLRRAWPAERVVLAGSLGTAAAIAAMAVAPGAAVAAGAALLAGASWIAVLSSFHVSAQSALPNWVRARGLSLFLTAFFGAMSGGSLAWGLVAEVAGVAPALLTAAAGLTAAALATARVPLGAGGADPAPGLHWPAAPVPAGGDEGAGPVAVCLDYRVADENAAEFLRLVRALGRTRRRDGAYDWMITRSAETPSLYREMFFVGSWTEHLRQHERVTAAERDLQARIAALTLDGAGARVGHFLTPLLDRGG